MKYKHTGSYIWNNRLRVGDILYVQLDNDIVAEKVIVKWVGEDSTAYTSNNVFVNSLIYLNFNAEKVVDVIGTYGRVNYRLSNNKLNEIYNSTTAKRLQNEKDKEIYSLQKKLSSIIVNLSSYKPKDLKRLSKILKNYQ